MTDVIRIGNCSGYYGDRLAAAREMVEGGPIDVLTGDYLAELTMSILHEQREKRGAQLGYVGTFLKQLRDVAAPCLDRGIRIVTNAGGLNPRGMAQAVQQLLGELGLDARVAWIEGDDLIPRLAGLMASGETFRSLDTGVPLDASGHRPVTANAYLGAWGIVAALERGADIVICPRVTDAAVVIGPAAWHFGWRRDDYDALAGALAAGHVIECGAQCCGGNYAFFEEVPSFRNVGYPIAEIERDGTFTVTKHADTGGLVSVGTVTAQLLYEIGPPEYLNPDVIAHFDTMTLAQSGPDRVRVSGTRGSSPPQTHKVCVNAEGPFKQSFEFLITGLDIDRKVEVYLDTIFANIGGREQFDGVDVQLIRNDTQDPATNEQAHARLRLTLTASEPDRLGRVVAARITELMLANIPGLFGTGQTEYRGEPVLVHWPTLVDSRRILERVHIDDDMIEVPPTQQLGLPAVHAQSMPVRESHWTDDGETVRVPFGRLFGTRSGDKGGAANCGVWARDDAAFDFLNGWLTIERFAELLPDFSGYPIERHDLPNLRALNFVVRGVLGDGVSSNHRIDKQAKSFGEYLRARLVDVPRALAADIREAIPIRSER